MVKAQPIQLGPGADSSREVILDQEGDRTPHEIESSKRHGRQILVKLRGVDGIDDARKWVGATLCVDAAARTGPGNTITFRS
jgi:ribosomal 30S subunit maturation factor RimM